MSTVYFTLIQRLRQVEMYHIYLADFVNIYNIALYNLLFIVEAILQSDL